MIAVGAFGLNLLSVRLATLVRTDMPLALVIFLLGLLIWQKIRAREPWQLRERWEMFALLTASRHRAVSMARRETEWGKCMVRLVAMDCVSRVAFSVGSLRHQVRPGLL